MSKCITLDATPFMFTHGGVGRTTLTLFRAMLKLQPEYRFRLYARRFKGGALAVPENVDCFRRFRLPKSTEPLLAKLGMVETFVNADLYHATDHYMPLKHPENAVVTIHDLLFMTRPEPDWDIHAYQLKVVPSFAKKCRQIITCSNYTKKDIMEQLQISPESIHVVSWGIDQSVFHPPTDKDALHAALRTGLGIDYAYFLAVGCNCGRKNTPRLLEAYAEMVGDTPANHLVLVWDPPAEIRQKYAQDPCCRFIHFTGKVTDELLVNLYQGATATVYPSDYEGFGLPVLESFACGVPVITSDRSSLPEVGGGAAIYINPDDCGSIRDAMCNIENHSVDLCSLRKKGLDVCNKFTWEACAAQTLRVYDMALEGM